MPTLSQTTSKVRSITKWVGTILGVLSLILIGVRGFAIIKDRFAPPPPPTSAYGILPQIPFPKNTTDKKFTYKIDTLTGLLPTFPDRAKVYKTLSRKPDLLALSRMQERVSQVGFDARGIALSESTHQWSDNDSTNRKIVANIFTSDFTLSSSFIQNSAIQTFSSNDDLNTAIEVAQDFLVRMSLLPEDIALGETKASFFFLANSNLVPVESVKNTTIIRVDFFQKDVDKLLIYYPKPKESTMNFLVAKIQDETQVVAANFYHQDISTDFATYPIKTAEEALSELKQGKAYIASFSDDNKVVLIKNISLGFYLGEKEQEHLIPIAVFEGENGFFAYVSLIRDEWISK